MLTLTLTKYSNGKLTPTSKSLVERLCKQNLLSLVTYTRKVLYVKDKEDGPYLICDEKQFTQPNDIENVLKLSKIKPKPSTTIVYDYMMETM